MTVERQFRGMPQSSSGRCQGGSAVPEVAAGGGRVFNKLKSAAKRYGLAVALGAVVGITAAVTLPGANELGTKLRKLILKEG